MTDCNLQPLLFQPHAHRSVVADFDGGTITSDAGGLLLREVELKFGIVRQFAQGFTDHRQEEKLEFTATELLLQRVMALALGYEDLNDHEQLRHDPLLALLCGRAPNHGRGLTSPTGPRHRLSLRRETVAFEVPPGCSIQASLLA